MIAFTRQAIRQANALRRHFEERERPEAIDNLADALEEGWELITANPSFGLPAPRPYPRLSRPGRLWIHVGRYWIAYSTQPLAITAIFHDTADIPGRI